MAVGLKGFLGFHTLAKAAVSPWILLPGVTAQGL